MTTASHTPHRGTRLIAHEYQYPDDHWRGWGPGHDVGRIAREIAEALADPGAGRTLTARSVERINADSLRKKGIVAHNVIWVPDRTTGEVAAIVDFTLIETPGGV